MKKEKFFYVIVFLIIFIIITFIFNINIFIYLKNIIWALSSVMIIASGLFFSFKTKFKQLHFKKMFSCFKNQNDKNGINTISSLTMSLAGRIGVGSLAGVALAIYLGGVGSIFWMWVVSLIASANTYVEGVLGVIYKTTNKQNINSGGPFNYIKIGLNYPLLASLYAIILIISYIGGFLTIQTNTIVKVTSTISFLNPFITISIIGIVMGIVIFGGVKKIAKFNLRIVSLMGSLFLSLGLFIIIKNISLIPNIFISIIKGAFNFKSLSGGFLYTLVIGFQRGIFASEAGLGTSSISSAMTNDSEEKQGLTQALGIHITTLLVCTITAIIIILTDYNNLIIKDINGIEITQYAFNYHLGSIGNYLLIILAILFSYSTIISGYYYGESGLKFLFPKLKNKHLNIFKILCIIITMLGGIVSPTSLWLFTDISVAILIIINIYASIKLNREIT